MPACEPVQLGTHFDYARDLGTPRSFSGGSGYFDALPRKKTAGCLPPVKDRHFQRPNARWSITHRVFGGTRFEVYRRYAENHTNRSRTLIYTGPDRLGGPRRHLEIVDTDLTTDLLPHAVTEMSFGRP